MSNSFEVYFRIGIFEIPKLRRSKKFVIEKLEIEITVKLGYNELGYNELGYNEHPVITNKMKSNGWFQSF
jgi:hypothetical protein